MSAYLENKYLLEKIQYIDEGFFDWANRLNVQTLVDTMKKTILQKDHQGLLAIFSKLPKVDFQKLFTMADKINPRFNEAFGIMKKQMSKLKIKGRFLDYISLSFAVLIVDDTDMEKSAKKIVDSVSSKVKKLDGGSISLGIMFLILSGSFIAAAVATMHLIPLLIAIALVGLSMAATMG
jgi:hypothetical protein